MSSANPFETPIRLMRLRHRLEAYLNKKGINTATSQDAKYLIEELFSIEMSMYEKTKGTNK